MQTLYRSQNHRAALLPPGIGPATLLPAALPATGQAFAHRWMKSTLKNGGLGAAQRMAHPAQQTWTLFIARAQKNLDLGPYEYSFPYYQKEDKSLVPLPFDEESVFNKMWQFSPPSRFGTKYRDAIVNALNIHLYTYRKRPAI